MARVRVANVPAARIPLLVLTMMALPTGCGFGSNPPPELDHGAAHVVEFTIEDPQIRESSGLAASRAHPGVYYTHNDMGWEPQVFAVSSETGETEAVLDLKTTAVDWEDIAVTDSGVWVGDIGGGATARKDVTVLTFPEPTTLEDGSPEVTEYTLTYDDGAHDAEALLVDPRSDQVYVVTKAPGGGTIYAAPPVLGPGVNTLTRVDDAPSNVTSGSWAPNGSGFALRNYPRAYVYAGFTGPPIVVDLPESRQGESLVLLADGDLLVGSEGRGSEVTRVRVPGRTR
jgi:hypothetical protein